MLTSQYNTDMDILNQVLQKATKMSKGLEHLSYKERLRELDNSWNLEKNAFLGNLTSVYKCKL